MTTSTQIVSGPAARTDIMQHWRVTWDHQIAKCCGQVVRKWDQTEVPVYLTSDDAEPKARIVQCGGCGTLFTAKYHAQQE